MEISNIIHADIFFFVTTIAVGVLTIVLLLIFLYVFKIVRTVEYMVQKVKVEGEQVIDDLSELREQIKEKGSSVSKISTWAISALLGKLTKGVFTSTKRKRKNSKTVHEDDSSKTQ